MTIYTSITFVLVCIILIDLLECVPTFGDEYVHIKVHVPKDLSNSYGILKATHEGSPEHPHIRHKHVHHYHRRRKPFKKLPHLDTGPLLENIILSELDKPEVGLTQGIDIGVKELPTINTFTVIEETVKKPVAPEYDYKGYSSFGSSTSKLVKDHVETYRIVETKRGHHPGYNQESQPQVQTVKVVDNDYYIYPAQGYKKQPHQETIKIVEEHQHASDFRPTEEHTDPDYNEHSPLEETLEIIKTPNYKNTEEYEDLKKLHHYYKEYANKDIRVYPNTEDDDLKKSPPYYKEYENKNKSADPEDEELKKVHQYYKEDIAPDPETELHYEYETSELEMVKAHKSFSDHHTKYVKYHKEENSPSYKYTRPAYGVHESIETLKSKNPQKYQHSMEYENSKTHYDYSPSQKEEIEEEYRGHPKCGEEHEEFTERQKSKYHYLAKESEDSKITKHYHDYLKTSTEDTENEEPRKPSKNYEELEDGYRKPFEEYGNKENYKTSYNEYSNNSPVEAEEEKHYKSHVENKDTGYRYNKPQQTQNKVDEEQFAQNIRTGYQYQKPSTVYSSQHLIRTPQPPSPSPPPSSRHSYRIAEDAYSRQALSSNDNQQNTLFVEFPPFETVVSKPKLNSNIDWPEGVGKVYNSETYTGYDSYSAGHVQGVDSGGYRYHASRQK